MRRPVGGDHREDRPPQIVVPAIDRLLQAGEEPGRAILLHEELRELIEHPAVVVGEVDDHAGPARQQHQPDLAVVGQGPHELGEVVAEVPEEGDRAVRVIDDQRHPQRLVDELRPRFDADAVVLEDKLARVEVGHRLAVAVEHPDEPFDLLRLGDSRSGRGQGDGQDDDTATTESLIPHETSPDLIRGLENGDRVGPGFFRRGYGRSVASTLTWWVRVNSTPRSSTKSSVTLTMVSRRPLGSVYQTSNPREISPPGPSSAPASRDRC